MLWGLGRWLRAAGYDTATAARGLADGELLRRAGAEGRVLLTLDRALEARAGAQAVAITLGSEGLDAGARELRARLGIDSGRRWSQGIMCLHDSEGLRGSPPGVNQQRAPPAEPAYAARVTTWAAFASMAYIDSPARSRVRGVNRKQHGDNC